MLHYSLLEATLSPPLLPRLLSVDITSPMTNLCWQRGLACPTISSPRVNVRNIGVVRRPAKRCRSTTCRPVSAQPGYARSDRSAQSHTQLWVLQ